MYMFDSQFTNIIFMYCLQNIGNEEHISYWISKQALTHISLVPFCGTYGDSAVPDQIPHDQDYRIFHKNFEEKRKTKQYP